MSQQAPIKLHYQYDGTVKYHVSNINVVLQEVAQAIETFSPSSLENSQNFLIDIACKLKSIQDSSIADCQLFESYSNRKQTEYESGLKKLKESENLYRNNFLKIGAVSGARKAVWELLGYDASTCSESREKNDFRIPRLLVDPTPQSFPYSDEEAMSYFKEKGFIIFVPNLWEAYLVEAKIDQSSSVLEYYQRRNMLQTFLKSLFGKLMIYRHCLIQLDNVYSVFKGSHCGAEIASTNQIFRFFSYVEKRINLLINKVELIEEQGKIFGSLSEDIFHQELSNPVLELIDVINLKVQENK